MINTVQTLITAGTTAKCIHMEWNEIKLNELIEINETLIIENEIKPNSLKTKDKMEWINKVLKWEEKWKESENKKNMLYYIK